MTAKAKKAKKNNNIKTDFRSKLIINKDIIFIIYNLRKIVLNFEVF